MGYNILAIPKQTYDYYGNKLNTRKPFKTSTKKIEWNRSAGRNDAEFKTTSKCRNCPRKLQWGDKRYEFDHWDNNNSNNSQSNCRLVCLFCHTKNTNFKRIKQKDKYTGIVIGHKTIKLKTGYKKLKKRKPKKSKKTRGNYYLDPLTGKKVKVSKSYSVFNL